MKILMLSLSAPERAASAMLRTLSLAKGLRLNGGEVTLLCTPAGADSCSLLPEGIADGVNIIRTGENTAYRSVVADAGKSSLKARLVPLARKLWHAFVIYDHTYSIAKNVSAECLPEKSYDLLISVSDPKTSHIAARGLERDGVRFGARLQYWGDPFAGDITKKSVYPRTVIRRAERRLLGGADGVVYVSPFTLEMQRKLFPELADRMIWLPIPYAERREYPRAGGEFTVSYVGAYASRVRNILPLYEACRDMDGVRLDIMGDSDLKLEPTDSVRVLDRGRGEDIESGSDLLVCVMNRTGTQIPGKVYYAAATNLPVLIVLDGERADDLRRCLEPYGRYIFCRNDRAEIERAIRAVAADRPVCAPLEDFSCEKIAADFIEYAERIGP